MPNDTRTLEERLEWIANWSEPDHDLADAAIVREALARIKALSYALACIANPDWKAMTPDDARELAAETLNPHSNTDGGAG